MLKPLFDSTTKNIKIKLSNPFWGTFILVFIIHNWRLFYAPFIFPVSYTFSEKLNFLSEYLDGWNLVKSILLSIVYSFVVLALSYLLMGVGKYISNIYHYDLLTFINSKSSGNSENVLRVLYDSVIRERDSFIDKYENIKKKHVLQSNELDELKDKISDIEIELNKKNLLIDEKDELLSKAKAEKTQLEKQTQTKVSYDYMDYNEINQTLNDLLNWYSLQDFEKRIIEEILGLAVNGELFINIDKFSSKLISLLIDCKLLNNTYQISAIGKLIFNNMKHHSFSLMPRT